MMVLLGTVSVNNEPTQFFIKLRHIVQNTIMLVENVPKTWKLHQLPLGGIPTRGGWGGGN